MPGPELQNIVQYWRTSASRFPNKTAAIYEGRTYSWREVDELSARAADALRRRCGIAEGEPIAIAMPNCVEFYLAYWAVMRAGGVVAAITCRLGEEELARCLAATGAR